MEKPPLPMNTVLDGPERDPMLDDEAVAVLKAVYLRQPQVPEFRARGMSDTEIVENKRLGAVLAFIREQQIARAEPRSKKAPRRRDQSDARLFKVG